MLTPLNYQNYRAFLKDYFGRPTSGRRLSLSAFARRGGMSPSYLSRIVGGQRHLSIAAASRISHLLDLSPEEETHLMRLVAAEKVPGDSLADQMMRRRIAVTTRAPSRRITNEQFDLVADWQHFAILALTNTRDFKPSPAWIGRRLGIPSSVARDALERLLNCGLLKKEGLTVRALEDAEIETPPDVPSKAVRENHRQHLALAEAALREIELEMREFVNSTLAMTLADVPKAKRRLRMFVERFSKDLEKKPGDELFQINVQFYRLSKKDQGVPNAG
jgi:uncharacterized protein (TIGR02147 family)